MITLKVGDVAKMKYGIKDQRIVGVYPMNGIPTPDRVDIWDADDPTPNRYIGVPISFIQGYQDDDIDTEEKP